MRKVDSLRGKWQNAAFLLGAVLIVTADQLSKVWIRFNLALGESIPETGLFRITHVHNTGAIFGIFPDQSFLLSIVAIVGIVILLLITLFFFRHSPLLAGPNQKLALGLILGGTVGNLIDRIRLGGVTDFIDIGFWPAFNVADSAVVVGSIIFAYSLLHLARTWKADLAD